MALNHAFLLPTLPYVDGARLGGDGRAVTPVILASPEARSDPLGGVDG